MIQAQTGVVETEGMPARSIEEKTLTQTIGDALNKRIRLRPNDGAQVDSHFAQVIEATPDFIVTMDVKGQVLYCNRAVRQMLGMSDEDTIAKQYRGKGFSN